MFLNEINPIAKNGVLVVGTENCLQTEKTVRVKKLIDFCKVAVHVAVTNGLEHFQRNDLVELASQISVIAKKNFVN